jgi:hypothetical protein
MQFLRVHQKLVSNPLADIPAAVREQLDRLKLTVPRGAVAITAGSRGISNIATVLRAAGGWLRDHGARPFVVPAMGTHNGGTAEGQVAMLESLGITEKSLGMPIRASMECVKIGTVPSESAVGSDVWMDRYAYESAGVLIVNRVKLHTSFSGPVQSGLAKMMTVGLGKVGGARTFHDTPTAQLATRLPAMRDVVLASGKIWAGLAILEDGFDQTAELHAVRPQDFAEVEPRLVARHEHYFPRLPLEDINVLVVDTIGKTYSGTGMDTNIIGFRGTREYEDLDRPRIRTIAVLNLAKESHGNALGIGFADYTTARLRSAIDEEKMFLNAFTTGHTQSIKIPPAFRDDEELFERLAERFGTNGWLVIPNTLHLETLYASPDLRTALEANPICRLDPQPVTVTYSSGRHQLGFDGK